MTPITAEQIIDLAEGRLPPSEAAALRARIATDPVAQAELQEFEALISLMRDDDSVDAPDHVIARALRLMRPSAPAPKGEIMRRFIATLLGDSWQRHWPSGYAPIRRRYEACPIVPKIMISTCKSCRAPGSGNFAGRCLVLKSTAR
jgi:hypothetical protein